MMYNYPFFSFPHSRRYTCYPNYVNRSNNITPISSMKNPRHNTFDSNQQNKKEENHSQKVKSGFSFLDNFLHQEDRDENEKYFEILGIKLYDDDILLLCLIFFLYKEDVKDPYLFIALVLLLLS